MAKKETTWAEIKELFKETDQMFKETDQQFKETDQKFKETDQKLDRVAISIEELKEQISKTESMFTSQWGKLMESLVAGDLVRILNERGIPVNVFFERIQGAKNGHNFEFDIVAADGPEVVVVEVKTTLKPKHVKEFIPKLQNFKNWVRMPHAETVYGAIAFLKADAGAEKMVQNQGLFAIRAAGDSASIINPVEFVPRAF